MAKAYEVRVSGLRELVRVADAAGPKIKRLVRDDLRKAAEPVKEEAARLFSRIDPETASTYGISVRRTGVVSVEQRRRKVTGTRPDYGTLQIREALEPALQSQEGELMRRMDQAVDRIADTIDGGFHV